MTTDAILEHQTVVVEGDRITAVGPASAISPPPGALVVDGRGKFLMPGLVDAHVHLMEEADLPQFLFYGVTTVRNLMGSEGTLRLKHAVAAGSVIGPRIITSGPLLSGPEVPWPSKVVPAGPAAARAEVRRQRYAGFDLIKVYDGLTADVYAAITDEAARLGMRVTGHIPSTVHLGGVLQTRQDLEHTDKMVYDVWGHRLDAARIDSVAREIQDAGVFVTPTIASMQQLARIGSGGFDSLLARPEARRVGTATLTFWCEVSSRLRGSRVPGAGVQFNPWTDFQMQVIAGLHRARVPLLAGTDYPNAMLAAGSGLLEEVRALHAIGLTRFEALAAATVSTATAIDDSTSGVIARGARADLILLPGNPLTDLRVLDENDGVMAAGKWYPASELGRLAPPRAAPPSCST